jgi:Flp pilus assembly pilin Flp
VREEGTKDAEVKHNVRKTETITLHKRKVTAMLNAIRQFVKEEEGLAAAEYAILLTLVAVALIVSVGAFRDGIIRAFQAATAVMPAAS